MSKSKKITYFEIALYLFISVIAIVIPLFDFFEGERGWDFVLREWIRLLPFFIIFLINNFVLAPKLLLKSKFPQYIIACLILLTGVAFVDYLLPHGHGVHRFKGPPEFKQEQRIPEQERNKIDEEILDRDNPPVFREKPKLPRKAPPKPLLYWGIFLLGFLIIGFNSGMKIFIRWLDEQEKQSEKERQYLSAELAVLKQQVSPHFLMNTLNNIHALIDFDSEKAKDSIIKLSRLMRYMLYESNTEQVPIKKEIDFIESYIELMRLRYDESKLSIRLSYPAFATDVYVPTLLFLPVIENAFKHGIDASGKSFVDIQFKMEASNLLFQIENGNFPVKKRRPQEASGIGLKNIKRRLDLIYPNNYSLDVSSSEEIFSVTLSIPV